MASHIQAQEASISLVTAMPAEVYAGSAVPLKVQVARAPGCTLEGEIVQIVDGQGVVVGESTLSALDEGASATAEFTVTVPFLPGEYSWTARRAGTVHERTAAGFSFVVKPHATGMAVWDVPSPIVIGALFKIKVGVQCSEQCALAGREIAIYNHQTTRVAAATLGAARWSEEGALYWAEVELRAPEQPGHYVWESRFAAPDMEPAHDNAVFSFALTIANPPDCVVTVLAIDAETQAPIPGADVILHPYRGTTDESGWASLTVPSGQYEVYVCAHEKQIAQTRLAVSADATVRVEMTDLPPESE